MRRHSWTGEDYWTRGYTDINEMWASCGTTRTGHHHVRDCGVVAVGCTQVCGVMAVGCRVDAYKAAAW
jgi:hypothetical protein